ncbi:MAG: IclR family transcriptional regulator [Burkholderiaceae bacterium]
MIDDKLDSDEQPGIQSLEIGLRLARALAASQRPMPLRDVAAAAGMARAKAHRYLVSLLRSGLAEQDRESGHYRLGPLALEFGLAALGRLDVNRLGGETLADLGADIDETVILSVYGNRGPVVSRWLESSRPVATNVRTGWVMPLTVSATGRCFAAYLPPAITAGLLQQEFTDRPALRDGFAAELARIRARGVARVDGDMQAGIAAVAAPVFGLDGRLAAVIAALGPQGAFDLRLNGRTVQAVKEAAARLSARLGHAARVEP